MNKRKPGEGADFYIINIARVKQLPGFLLADFSLGFGQLDLIGDN